MLKSILTILTVLIISTCIQTTVDTQTKCIDANPYIKVLQKERGLVVLPHPTDFNKTTCKSEWKDHGVCCNETSAIAYATQDAEVIRSSVTSLVSSLKELAPLYIEFMKKAPMIKGLVSQAYRSFIEVVEKNQAPNLTRILSDIQQTDSFKQSFDRCWEKMIQIRSSSVCSTCSGRSAIFFEGEKGLVKSSDCIAILDQCTQSFQLTFDLFVDVKLLMAKLSEFSSSLGKTSVSSSHQETVAKLNAFVTQVTESKIQSSVNLYIQAASRKDSPEANTLCAKLVKLSEKTFIEELASVAASISLEMKDYMKQIGTVVFLDIVKTSLQTASNKISTGISNWVATLKKRRRVLPEGLPATDPSVAFGTGLLFGDINVVSDQPLASSSPGLGQEPINLSVQFP
jgi:hypothetical protein